MAEALKIPRLLETNVRAANNIPQGGECFDALFQSGFEYWVHAPDAAIAPRQIGRRTQSYRMNEPEQPADVRGAAAVGVIAPSITQGWQQAIAYYEQRDWAQSEQWCGRVLAAQANHLGARHLLGIIYAQTSRLDGAAALLGPAVAAMPQHAALHNDYGTVLLRLRRINEAMASFGRALQADPLHAEAHSNLGNALAELGQVEQAPASYERALQLKPRFAQAHNNRGNALRRLGRLDEALSSYDNALQLEPQFALAHNNRGTVLHDLGQLNEALECYEHALSLLGRKYAEGHNNRGNALRDLGQIDQALTAFEQALSINPAFAEAHNNRGNVLRDLGRVQDALEAYERALHLNQQFAEAHNNRGNALRDLGALEQALPAFEQALRTRPDFAGAHVNRGNLLRELRRLDEAREDYRAALRIAPQLAEAHTGLGNVLRDLGRLQEALECYRNALRLRADSAETLNNRGHVLAELSRVDEAAESYQQALRLDPKRPWLYGTWLHTKMQLCSWNDLGQASDELLRRVAAGEQATPPFALLALTDNVSIQRRAAEIWNAARAPKQTLPVIPRDHSRGKRIRVAYISGDLREHPLAYLMAGVFEQHDRQRFEVLGVSLAAAAETAFGRRVASGFDRFVDISGRSDREAAELLRALGIDIAIDLMGMTLGRRIGILALRAAPVQVSYLGFPGTLGASYMDYLLADEFVIPRASRAQYSEAVAAICPSASRPMTIEALDRERARKPKQRGSTAVGLRLLQLQQRLQGHAGNVCTLVPAADGATAGGTLAACGV